MTDLSAEVARLDKRTRDAKEKGFSLFINTPLVRISMANIPPGSDPDLLRTLLEAAFTSGFGEGQACIITSLAEKILKNTNN